MNTTTIETIVRTLQEHNVKPDEDYTARAGHDYGYVAAWQLPKGDYVILYGDNGETNYALAEDADDLACWLLPGGDGSDAGEDAPVVIANVRGEDAVQAASPEDEGLIRVLLTHYYYGPTEQSNWWYDYDHQAPYEFFTYAEAEAAIAAAGEQTYLLAHNQSGRASLKIVKV